MPRDARSALPAVTRPGSDQDVTGRGRTARRGILERLRDGVVLGDGSYILELERRGYVQAGPYTPGVAVEHPEALRDGRPELVATP